MKVGIIAVIFTFLICYIAIGDNNQLEAQQKTIDSLQVELFQAQSQTGRYEIALELLSQEDTIAAAKFDSLYNETE